MDPEVSKLGSRLIKLLISSSNSLRFIIKCHSSLRNLIAKFLTKGFTLFMLSNAVKKMVFSLNKMKEASNDEV